MPPAKQNTDLVFACNNCSSKYAHKGSHVKTKHKEKTRNDMTKSIVEDVINIGMTREIPTTKLTCDSCEIYKFPDPEK